MYRTLPDKLGALDMEGLNALDFGSRYGVKRELLDRLVAAGLQPTGAAQPLATTVTYNPLLVLASRCNDHVTSADSFELHCESALRIEVPHIYMPWNDLVGRSPRPEQMRAVLHVIDRPRSGFSTSFRAARSWWRTASLAGSGSPPWPRWTTGRK